MKARIAQEYADLIYNGLWFTAYHQDLAAFVQSTQRHVSGAVRMRLHKGQAVPVGRRSPKSLYDHALATYDKGDQFDQSAAVGFIKHLGAAGARPGEGAAPGAARRAAAHRQPRRLGAPAGNRPHPSGWTWYDKRERRFGGGPDDVGNVRLGCRVPGLHREGPRLSPAGSSRSRSRARPPSRSRC